MPLPPRASAERRGETLGARADTTTSGRRHTGWVEALQEVVARAGWTSYMSLRRTRPAKPLAGDYGIAALLALGAKYAEDGSGLCPFDGNSVLGQVQRLQNEIQELQSSCGSKRK